MEALFSDPEEEKAYTQSYYQNVYCFYGFGIWLLERKTDGELLGRAGLEVNENGEFVLGYMLAAKYQHQGYAYEACQGILEYAHEYLELEPEEIIACIEPENRASVKLAEKLGITIRWIEKSI